ncbi:hypothetical protein JFU37_26590 [Pseudomonas sp. TH41]|nr:hypothetical protein [Pseudomonas sp. TH41]
MTLRLPPKACVIVAPVRRRSGGVSTVGKDQRIVVTPSGEGLAIFETGLAIAYLFAHHFHGNMPIILFVAENTSN